MRAVWGRRVRELPEGDPLTMVEQIPFEALDDAEQRTPAWEQYRKQRGTTDERRTIPKGTYEATLIESTIVRRKDGGGFVIRLVARTDRLGVYLSSWRGLSSDAFDPFSLTDGQVKSLRKFAVGMGIAVPAPASEIVGALVGMYGKPVMARVVHTPIGIQCTFFREGEQNGHAFSSTFRVAGQVVQVNGHLVDGSGEVVSVEGRARDAYVAHAQLLSGLGEVRQGLVRAAEGCFRLSEQEGWLALGYETLSEYLASPEITISRAEFYRLADIWQSYVLDGGVEPALLLGAGSSKLEVPLPALKQGLVDAERAAADATSLTRRDLRERYRGLMGGDEDSASGDESEPVESRRRDVETDDDLQRQRDAIHPDDSDYVGRGPFDGDELVTWAENYGHPEGWAKKAQDLHAKVDRLVPTMNAAQTVTATLRRVLSEIGDPRQKRMGRELREAVTAALELAREHGLDAES